MHKQLILLTNSERNLRRYNSYCSLMAVVYDLGLGVMPPLTYLGFREYEEKVLKSDVEQNIESN